VEANLVTQTRRPASGLEEKSLRSLWSESKHSLLVCFSAGMTVCIEDETEFWGADQQVGGTVWAGIWHSSDGVAEKVVEMCG
jgi:hypothetical protein